ncbi:MAG TPA: TlpA family protein disulfide reductase [Thermoanaerobacterales bacterium]|nr:TlpA family protein disulfide reductase [Thermoanaerobacterales bacterium]
MTLRHKTPLLVLLFILLTLALFSSGCSTESKTENSSENSQMESESQIQIAPLAPDFELEDLSGKKIRLSSLRGKIVVLNFWSLGCKYCLQEMPDFEEFNRSKPDDVAVLMVNLDRAESKLSDYINNQQFSFTVLKDEAAETARTYMLRGVPTTFIVDKDGTIKARVDGALTKEQLESLVANVSQE